MPNEAAREENNPHRDREGVLASVRVSVGAINLKGEPGSKVGLVGRALAFHQVITMQELEEKCLTFESRVLALEQENDSLRLALTIIMQEKSDVENN